MVRSSLMEATRKKLIHKDRHFDNFLKSLSLTKKPAYLSCYEHVASPEFLAEATGTPFDMMSRDDEGYWEIWVDFWLSLGFDHIPIEIPLNCPLESDQTSSTHSHSSESATVISNYEDFEKYPWPDEENPVNMQHYEKVAKLLPEGIKMVAGVGAGPFEWATMMMGVMGLSYALIDDPDLVEELFRKIGNMHVNVDRQLAAMDSVGVIKQGDDLGFKTSTFLKPEDLREFVFPIYKRMAAEAHNQDKPFLLHSCGNLKEIYDDLIDDCKIDAKHSFEDIIMPVQEFKKEYGSRITPIGGLDVDVICRSSVDEIKEYTRKAIDECFYDGNWVLGTGNSLTDYMPVENYIAVLEEGRNHCK